MKVIHLISGVKRRRGTHGDNVQKIRSILKRLDSYDDILSDESGKYTDSEKKMLWTAMQWVKTGNFKPLDKEDENV